MNHPDAPQEAQGHPQQLPVPQRLDIPTLCRQGQVLSGQTPLARFTRLCSCRGVWPQQDAGPVTWTLTPSVRQATGDADQLWVALTVRGDIALQCQRCLERTDATLAVDKAFRFVHTEADLDRVDAQFEEADSDDEALLLAPGWPLMDWLEDELILALPIAPRHSDCQLLGAIDDNPLVEAASPNPFAVLKALKP